MKLIELSDNRLIAISHITGMSVINNKLNLYTYTDQPWVQLFDTHENAVSAFERIKNDLKNF